ncbi:hypothetical protein OA610_01580 [Prochlorococcus sp. AH-716-F13]|nr:hypothetical protein [Prochlorococcus sp. AH-716-F13]
MNFLIKKLFISVIFNSFLFVLLIIGLQNSSNKRKVNLLFEETVQLPIGFIVGTSFIAGSILGSFLTINFNEKS